ncbi:ribosome maturation factor RimP [Gordonia sinesedis]
MTISAERVSGVVERLVAGRGFDLEDLTVTRPAGRDQIVVTVDRDDGTNLDTLTDLSRELSAALDEDPTLADADYTLEVTSPGIGRPLRSERHWRRSAGRKVVVDISAPDRPPRRITGRAGPVHDGGVDIVVNNRGRIGVETVPLDAITTATTDVDFARPSVAELQRCGLDAAEIGRRRNHDPEPAARQVNRSPEE